VTDYVDRGDLVRLTRTFTNIAGVAADPSSVAVRVQDPNGTVTTPVVTNDAVGSYYADVTPDVSGRWDYRWATTGDPQTNEEGYFIVRRRRVPS
jgi:hypothetical protein